MIENIKKRVGRTIRRRVVRPPELVEIGSSVVRATNSVTHLAYNYVPKAIAFNMTINLEVYGHSQRIVLMSRHSGQYDQVPVE